MTCSVSTNLEKLFGKKLVSMYFMNSFIEIISVFCLSIWNNVSSEHSFISCFGIIEDHSNNFQKHDFNFEWLRNCSIAIPYSFVPNCREYNKMHHGGNYQDFLKWVCVFFRSYYLIIIK